MSYIGTPPSNAFTSLLKQDFSTSATTGYTLDHAVNNANDIALFINFVRQEPTAGYAASGTTLTLTSATASSDDMYCVYLGQALQTVNPANASVGASQLVDSSIALGKLSATGTKDATTFLRGDNTFASAGGTNTPYFFAYRNASYTISSGTWTKIVYDTEDLDSGSGFNTSTGEYTVPEAGKYYFEFGTRSNAADGSDHSIRIFVYGERTGSATTYFGNGSLDFRNNYGEGGSVGGSVILTCSANDVIKTYLYHQTVAGDVTVVNDTYRATYFLGYKIIE